MLLVSDLVRAVSVKMPVSACWGGWYHFYVSCIIYALKDCHS